MDELLTYVLYAIPKIKQEFFYWLAKECKVNGE
jgi:hypothetical protein